jgi:hypothetical protein
MHLGKRVEHDADCLAVAIGACGCQDHQAARGECIPLLNRHVSPFVVRRDDSRGGNGTGFGAQVQVLTQVKLLI